MPFVKRHRRKTLLGAFSEETVPATKDMMGAVMRQSEDRASRQVALHGWYAGVGNCSAQKSPRQRRSKRAQTDGRRLLWLGLP
ncbi:hypothetical protein MPL3356_120012 [Mesorhizobium plurifarium]|uniref:Uncharacterized protein n=1 Tax=Mesorhizobium plurifarium TaxID=69974 RepID=A0A090DB28_MESPL|nr:hypothetical protein MPL3356_120012 [Mesorhizobium plurifarium]CDX60377.1 hypothetical protein MPL3365_370016 [Mesorhizobium plurifarium]